MKQSTTMTALAALAGPAAAALPFGSPISACSVSGTAALTFDDGPADWTNELLDLLAERNVKATFFVNGDNTGDITYLANGKADTIKRIVAEGHQLASHGWAHIDMSQGSIEEQRAELNKVDDALIDIVGKSPTYYRPPFGSCDAECVATLKDLGYHNILWDVDTKDYLVANGELELSTLKSTVSSALASRDSALILAHDLHKSTVQDVAPFLIDEAKKNGLRLVTAGECLGDSEANWYRGGADEDEEEEETPEEPEEEEEEEEEEETPEVPEDDEEETPEVPEDDEETPEVPEDDEETPEDDEEETPETPEDDEEEDDKEDGKDDGSFENNPEVPEPTGAIHSTATFTKVYTITSCPNDACDGEDGVKPTDAPTSVSTWTTVYTITTCDDDKCDGHGPKPTPDGEGDHEEEHEEEHKPTTTTTSKPTYVPTVVPTGDDGESTIVKPTYVPSSGFSTGVHPTNGTAIPTTTPPIPDEDAPETPGSAAGIVQISGLTLLASFAVAMLMH